jgi:hypothetical protein
MAKALYEERKCLSTSAGTDNQRAYIQPVSHWKENMKYEIEIRDTITILACLNHEENDVMMGIGDMRLMLRECNCSSPKLS